MLVRALDYLHFLAVETLRRLDDGRFQLHQVRLDDTPASRAAIANCGLAIRPAPALGEHGLARLRQRDAWRLLSN